MNTILNAVSETKKLDNNGNPRYTINVNFLTVEHKTTELTKSLALRKTKNGFSFQSYNITSDLLKMFCKGIVQNPDTKI